MAESNADSSWKEEVRSKLIAIFTDDDDQGESLMRIFYYLDEEDRQYKDNAESPPAWRTLRSTLKADAVFKKYAIRLAEDTKRAEKDVGFRETMNTMYSNMMSASEDSLPEDQFQQFDLVKITEFTVSEASGFTGLARAWGLIPASSQADILALIPKIIANKQALFMVDEITSLVSKTGGNIVMVALAGIMLGADILKNLNRWWKGEITGIRCIKNIVDSGVTIGAGVGGGVAGAAVGSIFGPIGTLVGGVTGGLISSKLTSILVDRLTQTIFGVPKSESVENAYNYFGLKMTASNSEVNSAFHKLCLKHHPDKGGQSEDFIEVQMNMSAIKLSRNGSAY